MKPTAIFAAKAAMMVAACILPIAAAPATASPYVPKKTRPFSDNFTKDTALNPRWVLAEPNTGSSYVIGKQGLLLDASGLNGGSDLWPSTNYNASLLLQPITSSLDWIITSKIAFQVTNDYMGAGLVLTKQTGHFKTSSVFHRFEYGDNPQPGLEGFTNGTPDPNYTPFTGKLVYLKLEKSGATYTYSYSVDNKTWSQISVVTDPAHYTYVGLISVRQPYDGQTGVDAKPLFSYFDIKVTKN